MHSPELPTDYVDMVPFSDNGMKYYTGLFSSRPELKAIIREGSQIYHAS